MKKIIITLLLAFFLTPHNFAQVVKIETLSTGLLYPVDIQNTGIPGDNRLFVVEKRGRIKIVNRLTGAVNPVPFLDIYPKVFPISSVGDERGLLGLAFHPNYASNGYFYLNYITPGGKTIIARYQVSAFADTALTTSEQIIMNIYQPFSNHNGGNMMFGPEDGYLYISLGDGGSGGDPGNRAQNKDSLLGKTLRIDINNPLPPYYFSAPGNPFYGATPGRDEIFDWGLRNHWRCSFDRLTHDMWTADVGQNVYEEINFRPRCDTVGHNYGWRCYEANTAYNTGGCLPQANYVAPVYSYSHSLGCSVTGGYVYRGGHEGGLFGKYVFTDYCQGRIWAMTPNGSGGWNTNQLVQSTAQINNNYSSFGEDVDGELYLTGISAGRVYRLRDTACAPTAYIHAPDTLYFCGTNQVSLNAIYGTGLTYSWTIASTGTWTINSGQGTSSLNLSSDMNSMASIVVSVSNGTCAATSNTIVVIPATFISGLNTSYCIGAPSATLSGNPAGGSFSGPGITGNTFNPNLAGLGTHTINYTISDTVSTCYYTASGCAINGTKTVLVDLCTGIEEVTGIQNSRIYPNPGKAEFNLEFYAQQQEEIELNVYNVLGELILHSKAQTKIGIQTLPLHLSGAAEGMYTLQIKQKHTAIVKKILVSK